MVRRRALRVAGWVLVVVAATIASLNVSVGTGTSRRSCGSPLDVVTDRAGWEIWFTQDSADRSAPPLQRTVDCPGAVNRRIVAAAFPAGAGVALLAALAATGLRRATGTTSVRARSIRRLGVTVTVVGAALAAGGIVALGLILANADSTIFTFVSRPLVAAIGLVVLTPVLALIVGGRALVLVADDLGERGGVNSGAE